jgi:glycosyltransferase involved in cell wall biosynthesis
MASGKPIISTIKMGYCLLERFGCGLSLDSATPAALAQAILKVHDMPPEEYQLMGKNAVIGAQSFDYRILTEKLVAVIDGVARPRHAQARGE